MSNASDVGLSEIGQIAVIVHDLERAVRFYQEALGMKLLFRVPGMAFFAAGSVRLMLSLPEKPEFDHPGSILYFKVGDIRKVHATFKERGVPFEDEPHLIAKMETYDLWMVFFRDSEGNFYALMSEVAR
jgi:methylmalonyl-CoA/ethylmalonyl-CoA epimerase